MSRIPPPRIPLAPRIPLPPVCRGLPSREMRTPVVIAPPHRTHRGIPRATATGAFISTETQRTPTRTGVSVVPPIFSAALRGIPPREMRTPVVYRSSDPRIRLWRNPALSCADLAAQCNATPDEATPD